MNDEEVFGRERKYNILAIVEFCILMQNNNGIINKAPSYILEKYMDADGTGLLLDDKNKSIFDKWKEIWGLLQA